MAAATGTEQVVTLVAAVWMTAGLFIDGYAHGNLIDTATEDFFTPWHALFYSGFAVMAVWFGVIAARRPGPGRLWGRFPAGYRLGAAGVVLFAAGGVGDGIWHTAFGVEVSIDALLSPTHLLLLTGGLLILTAPLRAAWADPGDASGWRDLTVPIVATTLVTSLLAFFFTYAWGLSDSWWIAVDYDPITETGALPVMFGIPASLISTAVLVGPIVLLLRRWALPFGTATFLWVTAALLEDVAFHGDGPAVAAALAGGLAVDVVLAVARVPVAWRVRAAAFLGPVAMWSMWMWLAADSPGIGVPVEIWTGLIFFAGLTGLGLAVVAYPPPAPASRPADDHAVPAPPAS